MMMARNEQGTYVTLTSSTSPVIIPAETIQQMRRVAEAFHEEGYTRSAASLATLILNLVQSTGKPSFYADTPNGVCPYCGDHEEILYQNNKSYGVCHEHRLYWYLGRCFLPAHQALAQQPVCPPDLLPTYRQISTAQAFPKEVCPCCGQFRMHASWCLYVPQQQTSLKPSSTDVVAW